MTDAPHGHVLTNAGVWSPDGRRIVYDTRPDAEGAVFDGEHIETVDVETGEVRRLYTSRRGARCGVVTFHPREDRVVFILGPEDPTPDWQYDVAHRQGVLVDGDRPGVAVNLDARDLTPPFTPGALRGGSHVHVFHPGGDWVSFTYDDHLLPSLPRNVGVAVPRPVAVKRDHPRNHDGAYFSVLVTRTVANPRPGSDEIRRAFEEGWIGADGYARPDGTRQRRALAFQGEVTAADGSPLSEVFVADLPDDLTVPSDDGPLAGTETRPPLPPRGVTQRRLTFTADRRYPGIQGPRHWLRGAPDGNAIAFLMRDDLGVAQLWTVSPNGGPPRQVTRDPWGVASAFTWRPDGARIAYAADNSIFTVEVATGESRRVTPRVPGADAPLPLACIFSPDGARIAYLRRVPGPDGTTRHNQVFVARCPDTA